MPRPPKPNARNWKATRKKSCKKDAEAKEKAAKAEAKAAYDKAKADAKAMKKAA